MSYEFILFIKYLIVLDKH